MAIEVFADAVAQCALVIAEEFVEYLNIVRDQRLLVTRELRGHLGQHVGKIDFHC